MDAPTQSRAGRHGELAETAASTSVLIGPIEPVDGGVTCESCGTRTPPGAHTCPRCGRSLSRPPSVDLRLAGAHPQQRLTVLFRWILALPHLLYLTVLVPIALVAAVAGWFAALVLGRLPDGIRLFLGRVLNHYVRTSGYALFLLTDRYPPFALDRADHDVGVLLHAPTRLNRAAVLFRLVLAIPAWIVVQILADGVLVVMFFLWLVVLVTKRLPSSAFQAMAAILRYWARFYAYVLLLTPEYPRGLFGDTLATAPAADPETPPAVVGEPRITGLLLGKAAKRVVALALVIGVVGVGVQVAAISAAQENRALAQLDDAYVGLGTATNDFVRRSQVCAVSGDTGCLQAEVASLARALDTFLVDFRAIDMPQSSLAYASDVLAHGEGMLASLDGMAGATTEREYVSYAQAFEHHAFAFDDDYVALRRALYLG
jgi:hypothetical protein